jgi:hypothetical protein
MRSIFERIKESLFSNSAMSNEPGTASMTFVKTRKSILKALELSQRTGRMIGVYSRALGEGMFLTGIDAIEENERNGREVIVFETYDQSGHILSRTRVSLDEIKMVCPFNTAYVNPVLGTTKR